MMEHKPFFFVWREGGKNPKVKQPDFETAMSEARRLSDKMNGKKFFVLMEVGEVCLAEDKEWQTENSKKLAAERKS